MNRSSLKPALFMYLATLGGLTVWFLGYLALSNPLCTHCSVRLVHWAMPWAQTLAGGWLIAMVATFCFYWVESMVILRQAWKVLRQIIQSHKAAKTVTTVQ